MIKIQNFKKCPLCDKRLSSSGGSTTYITKECLACKRYTYYENLIPLREAVTQTFWDEGEGYNIIIFDYGAQERHGQKIIKRFKYTDEEQSEIFPLSYKDIFQRLETIGTFS